MRKTILKPCPCCGNEVYPAELDDGFLIYCLCGIRTEVFKSKAKAVTAWNNRPIEDELHEELKKLEAKNTKMRVTLEEIASGYSYYSREDMIRMAKEALK